MKRIAFLLIFSFSHFLIFAQMSDVFTSMPDTIFPLLTERNRHDMVDFYQNKMEAKVRNRFNDYARLDTLTQTYLRLTLSKSTSNCGSGSFTRMTAVKPSLISSAVKLSSFSFRSPFLRA